MRSRKSTPNGRGEEPRFVFRGTVRKLRASNEAAVKATGRTAIVRVDEVVRAPEALADVAGHDVTVELGGRDALKAGQQAMFYAHGWVFGESLAVYAVEHPLVEAAHVAMATIAGDPAANLANQDAKTRFDRASVVISGQVVSVSVPNGSAAAMRAAEEEEPMSEHAPIWREASVEVHAVHKGQYAGKRAVVRFPASTDVLWHRAPKFQPGQQGFFLLHRADAGAGPRTKLAAAPAGEKAAFSALHPADFQPFDQPGGVRALVDASAGQAPRPRRSK
ncbi:MAG TPA: hypothetical protein VLT86_17525 [Vicinamibacterales bacterium]|nr:hypothetical protein [Vicinamibacterales bacterium]